VKHKRRKCAGGKLMENTSLTWRSELARFSSEQVESHKVCAEWQKNEVHRAACYSSHRLSNVCKTSERWLPKARHEFRWLIPAAEQCEQRRTSETEMHESRIWRRYVCRFSAHTRVADYVNKGGIEDTKAGSLYLVGVLVIRYLHPVSCVTRRLHSRDW